jgi:predicted cupin superfamily sugar epimerase
MNWTDDEGRPMDEVRELIDRLGLARHPEGGWYRETWRAASVGSQRSAGTSILFLLEAGQRSHWHRVDATELWIFQAGHALTLSTADADAISSVRLGTDVRTGEQPQHVIAPGQWQSAQAGDGWCLVCCVVVPGFSFEGFELAPPGWEPGR